MEKKFPQRLLLPLILLLGCFTGLFLYLVYASRAHSYLSHDPSACVNCHIMTPYYQSWQKSSHYLHAQCNDCHVPQDNIVRGYAFKAKDGMYHAAVFTARAEPQVIRPRNASYTVIMENCIRCHKELNTDFVKTGMVKYSQVKEGKEVACWHCHRDTPHGTMSNIAMSPNAIAPLPKLWNKKLAR